MAMIILSDHPFCGKIQKVILFFCQVSSSLMLNDPSFPPLALAMKLVILC
jgi:hypothetical protein